MLPIVQIISQNKLRWSGHVLSREEESTLRVVMKLNMKGRRPMLRCLDNITEWRLKDFDVSIN